MCRPHNGPAGARPDASQGWPSPHLGRDAEGLARGTEGVAVTVCAFGDCHEHRGRPDREGETEGGSAVSYQPFGFRCMFHLLFLVGPVLCPVVAKVSHYWEYWRGQSGCVFFFF